MATKTVMNTNMVNINQENLFSKVQFPYSGESKTHTSLHKKLILCKRNSKSTVSKNVEKLYRELEKSDPNHLNLFIPYQHFKMERLHCLRNTLKKGDYMCKLDLKDAYFSVLLNPASRKFVRFLWSGKLYDFFTFVLGQAQHQEFLQNYSKFQFQCCIA